MTVFKHVSKWHPSARGNEDDPSKPPDDPACRHDFLQQHEDCKRGDPEKIHTPPTNRSAVSAQQQADTIPS
jgi:hypothetical protein